MADVVPACEAILTQAKEELKATTVSIPNAATEQRVKVLEAEEEEGSVTRRTV